MYRKNLIYQRNTRHLDRPDPARVVCGSYRRVWFRTQVSTVSGYGNRVGRERVNLLRVEDDEKS